MEDRPRAFTPGPRPGRPGGGGGGGGTLGSSGHRDGTPSRSRRATMEKKATLGSPMVGPPTPSTKSSAGWSPPRIAFSPRPGVSSSPAVGGGGGGGGGGVPPSPRQLQQHHLRRSSSGTIVPLGLTVGARVFLPTTRSYGVVRFCGPTHFASDLWVGVELDTPKGKNAGDVQGRKYFDCRPLYGIFVRPNCCTVLETEAALSAPRGGDEKRTERLADMMRQQSQEDQMTPQPPQRTPIVMASERRGSASGDELRTMLGYTEPRKFETPMKRTTPVSAGARPVVGSSAPSELQAGLLDEKWLVDMLVELVAHSDLLKDKMSDLVKEEVARSKNNRTTGDSSVSTKVTEEAAVVVSTALEKGSLIRREIMQEVDERVAASQKQSHDRVLRELEALRKDVNTHLKGLDDKVTKAVNMPVVVPSGGGGGSSTETLEDYTAALKSIAEAAKAARSNVMSEVENRIQKLAELSAMAES